MKLLSRDQIYEADRLTAERQGISSTDLMERAGSELFNWIHARMQGAGVPIHVFCGIGNNGGDGLVLSRHLINHGYHVKTYIVNYSEKRSKDFLINYERIKDVTSDWPEVLRLDTSLPAINEEDVIVDAIFGIGINRPPEDWVLKLFTHLEASKAFILSVDIPSGLFMDRPLEKSDHAVKANYTLSFQTPKLVFFLKETEAYTQQWEVLDIGLDQKYLTEVESNDDLIGKNEIIIRYKPRKKFSHKGDYGHALMVGGSYGKIGALSLASRACLHAGAGLVTAYSPKCGYDILQTGVPEVMVETDNDHSFITKIDSKVAADVVGIGMGMGIEAQTAKAFSDFISSLDQPVLIDADGINMLAKKSKLLKQLPEKCIITPHRGELKRLIGDWSSDFEMLESASKFSLKHELIIIIKGAHTIIVDGLKRFINTTGNPGMATAGSGDVLSGIITGLLAQGYDALDAAIIGVYLHGKAGDLAVEETAYQSLVASDLIQHLGRAYISLFEKSPVNEENSTDS